MPGQDLMAGPVLGILIQGILIQCLRCLFLPNINLLGYELDSLYTLSEEHFITCILQIKTKNESSEPWKG